MTTKVISKFIASILISFIAGGVGSLATIPNIPSWYAGLDKPPLLPPNEVFGPVWSVLYVVMGISLFLVWNRPKGKASATSAYVVFGLQLVLNAVWSLVFFGLHLPWLGFAIILGLIAVIVWTMVEFKKYSSVAMWLLAPYIAWVCFATYLTIGVAILN